MKKFSVTLVVVVIALAIVASLMGNVVLASKEVCNPKKGTECRCHAEPPHSWQGPARKYVLQDVVANDTSHKDHDNDVYIGAGESCPAGQPEPSDTPMQPVTQKTATPTTVVIASPTPTNPPGIHNPTATPTVIATNVVVNTPASCQQCEFWKELHQYVVGSTLVVELLNSNDSGSMSLKVDVVIKDPQGNEFKASGTGSAVAGQVARVVIQLPCEHGDLHAEVLAKPFHGGEFSLSEDFPY